MSTPLQTQTGKFRVTGWKEQTTGDDVAGVKYTHVRATMAYEGVIEGTGTVEFLMYSPDGRVTTFVGLEQVEGRVGDRAGTAVFEHHGTFADGVARSRWTVIPDSGTDGLVGLRGEGSYGESDDGAEHGGRATLSFSYGFGETA